MIIVFKTAPLLIALGHSMWFASHCAICEHTVEMRQHLIQHFKGEGKRKEQAVWRELAVLQSLETPSLLTFVYDGNTLLTAGVESHTATLWDLSKLGESATTEAEYIRNKVIAISPDGSKAASDYLLYDLTRGKRKPEQGLALWDLTDGTRLCKITQFESPVRSLAFTPDGKILTSGHYDGILRFWDISADKKEMTFHGKFATQKPKSPASLSLPMGKG
jgi:WD40 repeat protein